MKLLVVSAASLAMCAPAFADCPAHAEAVWQGTGGITVSAQTLGETCAQAVAVIIMRNSSGEVTYTWSARTQDVSDLMDARTAPDMAKFLAQWISSEGPGPTADK